MTAKTFILGGDLTVNRIGFGAMRLTDQPSNFGPYPEWEAGKALLNEAANLGANFFDSAWAYGPEHADRLLGEALEGREVVLATKGGIDKFSPTNMKRDASPARLRAQIEQARRNLRVARIDLFQLHWIDPETPLEVSMEALMQAREDGLIRHIGLSNVTRAELDRALAVGPVVSVQNRFNAAEPESGALVDYTAERNIAFIPHGPLGANPMARGATLDPQEALAWLLRRSDNIIVIPGTTQPQHLRQNMSVWNRV